MVENLSRNSLVVEVNIGHRIITGLVLAEKGNTFLVETETEGNIEVCKDQIIGSNMDHSDFCKCHKFCY